MTPSEFRDVLPRTAELLEAGIAAGQQIGAQVYVSRGGETVADFAMGESRPGQPMTPETLMVWLSSTKPFAAVAIAQLWERGKIDLDIPVAAIVPEFGALGKQDITLRHILTHTGGFRGGELGWPDAAWDQIIERVCAIPLEPGWIPGARAGYHIASSWFILGEVVLRVDGRFFSQYVRDEIFEPLDMSDSWIGMPRERYQSYGMQIGVMQNTEQGGLRPQPFSSEASCVGCSPAGSGHGPIRELGRFYETLLGGGARDGVRVLAPESVALFTSRQRVGMFDETFRHKMDWGLGFIVDSNRYGAQTVAYGYGLHCSEKTFGHSGFQSSTGYADPEHQLVVALVVNGTCGEARHNKRFRLLNSAIYEDLELN